MSDEHANRLGWIGAGRMGHELCARLLAAGHDVAVYNRTRAKAEPLRRSRRVARRLPGRARRPRHRLHHGRRVGRLRGGRQRRPRPAVAPRRRSADHRRLDDDLSRPPPRPSARPPSTRGTAVLAAPVSGNPRVVAAGRLTIVCSGPEDAWLAARPYLELFGSGVTYVGDGDGARLVKICHNLMLGVVSQCLAEITVLAEKGGIARADFLAFLNDSVMGSTFTRYKAPAYVNLDLDTDIHAAAAAQGLRSRLRGGPRAWRTDAGRRRGTADRSVTRRQRLHGRRLCGAARARGTWRGPRAGRRGHAGRRRAGH